MGIGGWIQLAWVAPAAALIARFAFGLVRLLRSEITAVPADEVLAAIGAALWIGLCFRPRWRDLLQQTARQWLERLPFAALAGIAALLALLAAPRGALGLGATVSALALTAAAAAQSLRRAPREFAFTVAVLGLNLVLLAAIDWVVGVAVIPARSHNQIMTAHDPQLGWRLRAGASIERQHERYTARETIGSLGYRTADRPFAKPPGTRRLVILGDSHTEAYTVNDHETSAVLLEQRLSESYPAEVISLGVAGYSTDQEFLTYLHVGRRFEPDLVLLQFTRNDPPFNVLDHYWRGGKPVFRRYGELLLLTGVPVPDSGTSLLPPFLIQHTNTGLLLELLLSQLAIERDLDKKVDWEEAWAVTRLLLRDLDAAVRGDGARLYVYLAIPHAETEQRLRPILSELGIPFIETEHVYSDPIESYLVKTHWNQRGQRVIAEALAQALREPLGRARRPASPGLGSPGG